MKFLFVLFSVAACASAATLESFVHPAFAEGRIINGYDAQRGEAPYIVSLQRFNDHFCAGTIIDAHWVLTAAHCLMYSNIRIVAGLHERNNDSDVQIRNIYGESYQIGHEQFEGGVGPHDIGLIYVYKPFDLNAFNRDGVTAVQKISLPSGRYDVTGSGKLFGWGQGNDFEPATVLQTLDVQIFGYDKCKAALPENSKIDPLNICTHNAGTADGVCNGDSGGPLVKYTSSGPEQVGIVSWGYSPCKYTYYPSVYTHTSVYKDWIKEKMENYVVPVQMKIFAC